MIPVDPNTIENATKVLFEIWKNREAFKTGLKQIFGRIKKSSGTQERVQQLEAAFQEHNQILEQLHEQNLAAAQVLVFHRRWLMVLGVLVALSLALNVFVLISR